MNLELLLSLQAKAWEVARDKSRGGWGCSFHAPHFYIFIVGSRRIGNALHNGAKAIFKWNSNCIHSKCELLSKLITRSCLKLNCIADAAAANGTAAFGKCNLFPMIVEAGAGGEEISPAPYIFRVTRWLEVCWTLSKFWKRRKVAWRAWWPRKELYRANGGPWLLVQLHCTVFAAVQKAKMYVPRMSIGGGRLGGGLTGGL